MKRISFTIIGILLCLIAFAQNDTIKISPADTIKAIPGDTTKPPQNADTIRIGVMIII